MREIRAVALGVAIVATYASLVLMSGRVHLGQFTRLFLAYVTGAIAPWVIIGFITLFVQLFQSMRLSGNGPFALVFARRSIAERWRRDRCASLLWPPLLFCVLLTSFNAFKQMVLPLAGFTFDPWLARTDRVLFLGHDGWRVTHALFGSPEATHIIDSLYHGWFLPMSLGVILCAWLPASTYRLRTQYLLSYAMVWIGLGSILAFLFPAAGPCFFSHFVGPAPQFDSLTQRLNEIQAINGTPLMALRYQGYLMHAQAGDHLLIGGGISAMPSVHIGLAVLFALAAWRYNPWLGYAFWVYALVIWIGSIHLGWHYGLDGLVSVPLTLLIWKACGRIADRLEKPLIQPAAEQALA